MTHAKHTIHMKSNIYLRFTLAIAVAVFMAACSAKSSDDNKTARLEKLKSEQSKITKEIAQLEEAIAKEHPETVKKAKSKEVAVAEIAPRSFDFFVQTQGSIESE